MTRRVRTTTGSGGRNPEPAGPTQDRVGKILAILGRTYPDARCELDFTTPLELLIATILSAQCTDARVNLTTPRLFRKYRSAKAFADADPAVLEEEIRTTGFFRSKARNIIACCETLARDFRGVVPRTMEELVTLPGVGRKTANILLYNAYGIPGFGVDTHVIRVTNRLGLVETEDPEKIEEALCQVIPREDWGQATHLFIFHGRRTCKAKQPMCPQCAVRSLCPWPGKP
ncbi:MAG TPA: endonuclease III [Candidatus Methylomirabilis sp.]|nr:endonuclease III [Candidatus Methylomirabilis sp.]